MARNEEELERKLLDLEKYAHLDSLEGVIAPEPKAFPKFSAARAKEVLPGSLIAVSLL